MHATMDYRSWVLRRDELLSEAARIRLAHQALRNGRTARNPFRLFGESRYFTTGDLRRQTP
jgi:hypothetical protein